MSLSEVPALAPVDHDAIRLVEGHVAEAHAAERDVPGVEVHEDDDVTWTVHSGSAWRNCAIQVRFSPSAAARRVEAIVARYELHGRGAGFWVSPLSTPPDLTALLSSHGLRCRKHFPAMIRALDSQPAPWLVHGVDILPLAPDGPLGSTTTPRGRCETARLRVLLADPARRTRVFAARHAGTEIGRVEIFVGRHCSGIHGISVHEDWQRRGIGSALLERACADAAGAGSSSIVLLATTEGQRLYQRRKFVEVARFGYWYRSFQRRSP